MENLLGVSIVALFVLSIIMIALIKALARQVFSNAEDVESMYRDIKRRADYSSSSRKHMRATSEDAWQQVLLLEDKVASLEMLLTAFKESNDDVIDNLILQDLKLHGEIENLNNQLEFHCERIDGELYDYDTDLYDWIAERDAEFANKCKCSYRYTPDGKLQDRFGK
tara:strand:+ start:125 stop:625 length:501 start_codon:yes stop_codon:yes gene_type:complete